MKKIKVKNFSQKVEMFCPTKKLIIKITPKNVYFLSLKIGINFV